MSLVECQLATKVARILGLEPGDLELAELVDLLVAHRNLTVRRLHWADAENVQLRLRVDRLELAAELVRS